MGRDFGGGIIAESLVSRREDPVEPPFRDEFVVDGEGVSEPPLCLVRFDRVVTSSSLSPGDGLLRRAMEGSDMGCPQAKSDSTVSLIYDEISLSFVRFCVCNFMCIECADRSRSRLPDLLLR